MEQAIAIILPAVASLLGALALWLRKRARATQVRRLAAAADSAPHRPAPLPDRVLSSSERLLEVVNNELAHRNKEVEILQLELARVNDARIEDLTRTVRDIIDSMNEGAAATKDVAEVTKNNSALLLEFISRVERLENLLVATIAKKRP